MSLPVTQAQCTSCGAREMIGSSCTSGSGDCGGHCEPFQHARATGSRVAEVQVREHRELREPEPGASAPDAGAEGHVEGRELGQDVLLRIRLWSRRNRVGREKLGVGWGGGGCQLSRAGSRETEDQQDEVEGDDKRRERRGCVSLRV